MVHVALGQQLQMKFETCSETYSGRRSAINIQLSLLRKYQELSIYKKWKGMAFVEEMGSGSEVSSLLGGIGNPS